MRRTNDLYDEYGPLPEEDRLPAELNTAQEYRNAGPEAALPVIEPVSLAEPEPVRSETEEEKDEKGFRHDLKRKLFFYPFAAVLSSVSIVFAATEFDPLYEDLLAYGHHHEYHEWTEDWTDEPTVVPPDYEDTFPDLPNKEPDFAGDYAWAGEGSEEYLFLITPEETVALHAGTYYTDKGMQIHRSVEGAEYDPETNVLTLTDFHGLDTVLEANLMGNGFTVKLVGENDVSAIRMWGAMYGGSITFTGDGSLQVNIDGNAPSIQTGVDGKPSGSTALYIQAEDSKSCLMIDREANVTLYGNPALMIHRTLMRESIYWLEPNRLVIGDVAIGSFVNEMALATDEDNNILFDEDGNVIFTTITTQEFGRRQGMDLYDCTVIGEDGAPLNLVIFTPHISHGPEYLEDPEEWEYDDPENGTAETVNR